MIECAIEVSSVEHLIRVKLSGAPPQERIVTMLSELNALTENDPSLSVLIDETELDPRFVQPGDMERFVGAWRGGSGLRSTRLAVFVSDSAMYGLNRMFEGMADADGLMGVFSDKHAAEAWLRQQRSVPVPAGDAAPH